MFAFGMPFIFGKYLFKKNKKQIAIYIIVIVWILLLFVIGYNSDYKVALITAAGGIGLAVIMNLLYKIFW